MEWFPQKNKDSMGRLNTPIELKLLSTLRILGRSCPYDPVVELTDISEDIIRLWHLKCIHKFSKEMYPIYVHGPKMKIN